MNVFEIGKLQIRVPLLYYSLGLLSSTPSNPDFGKSPFRKRSDSKTFYAKYHKAIIQQNLSNDVNTALLRPIVHGKYTPKFIP